MEYILWEIFGILYIAINITALIIEFIQIDVPGKPSFKPTSPLKLFVLPAYILSSILIKLNKPFKDWKIFQKKEKPEFFLQDLEAEYSRGLREGKVRYNTYCAGPDNFELQLARNQGYEGKTNQIKKEIDVFLSKKRTKADLLKFLEGLKYD